jgi:hypothetical protein
LGKHDPVVVQNPRLHCAESAPIYPKAHTGVQVYPAAALLVQEDTTALAISGNPEHTRVNTHTAPIPEVSSGPPDRTVVPLALMATAKP